MFTIINTYLNQKAEVRHEVEFEGKREIRNISHGDLQDLIDELTKGWDAGEALLVKLDAAAE